MSMPGAKEFAALRMCWMRSAEQEHYIKCLRYILLILEGNNSRLGSSLGASSLSRNRGGKATADGTHLKLSRDAFTWPRADPESYGNSTEVRTRWDGSRQ